jgi:hypothetical protein
MLDQILLDINGTHINRKFCRNLLRNSGAPLFLVVFIVICPLFLNKSTVHRHICKNFKAREHLQMRVKWRLSDSQRRKKNCSVILGERTFRF